MFLYIDKYHRISVYLPLHGKGQKNQIKEASDDINDTAQECG